MLSGLWLLKVLYAVTGQFSALFSMENCFSLNARVLFPSPVSVFVSLSWYSRYSWHSSFLLIFQISPSKFMIFSSSGEVPKALCFEATFYFAIVLDL